MKEEIAAATKAMARELKVIGLMNVQFAVQNENVYVLEVNPRASRTAPFVSKAIGVPLPKLAAKIMAGKTLKELGFTKEVRPDHYSVKEAVFPFIEVPRCRYRTRPGNEDRPAKSWASIRTFGIAYAKAQMAAQPALPQGGQCLHQRGGCGETAGRGDCRRHSRNLGSRSLRPAAPRPRSRHAGVKVKKLFKLTEGRPNALDMIKNGELAMIINTPSGKVAREDEVRIRSTANSARIPVVTTLRAAKACLEGIRATREFGISVKPLQEYHSK
ncbi:MAG: ATP-grasp domain-containing protein [Chthoniobacteraceae bacterium]